MRNPKIIVTARKKRKEKEAQYSNCSVAILLAFSRETNPTGEEWRGAREDHEKGGTSEMVGASIRLEFERTLPRMEIRKRLPFNTNRSTMLSSLYISLSFHSILFLPFSFFSLSLPLSHQLCIRIYSSRTLCSLHNVTKW